jgi:DNA mismatch repair protein MutS
MAKAKEQEEDSKNYTPMIEQYLEVKAQHPDVIIMFRIGDFYEMFFDDAKLASHELQLYLTGKSAGQKERVPMCGIPHHAYLPYVQKLLDNGHKVGIVEQMEDPKLAKGLVKRDVIQIITPGANLEIKGADNNYLAALVDFRFTYVLALADLSTGEIDVMNVAHSYQDAIAQLVNYDAKEVIVSTSLDAGLINAIKASTKICLTYFNNDESSLSYEPLFKYIKDERQMTAVSKLMNYLKETQKRDLDYFKPATAKVMTKILSLDHSSRVNLELTKPISGDGVYGSLYWLLNVCQTPMGERLLKAYINEPSADENEIEGRLDKVQTLIENYLVRGDLKNELADIYDLDRLIARVGFDSCSGKEMLQLNKSLKAVPSLKKSLESLQAPCFKDIYDGLSDFHDLTELLDKAISPDCPPTIHDGGIFKLGYDPKLDEIIKMATDGKAWLVDLETREKEKTGIHNLRVGYSKIFGYYIEVSNGSLNQVKPEFGWIRKQTMTTGERFITEELKNAESQILHAEEARLDLEYRMFQELREKVKTYTEQIQALSEAVSKLDVMVALSEVSAENRYVRPHFNRERKIEIIQARHPVIEKAMPDKVFVANDYRMPADLEVLIITGPNMGGKSTYMREFALLVIMAQMGCFVPAQSAEMYIFDAIFTRIGASDDLIKGESTFMVEMAETNHALRNATQNSLLLFDEIGRGTATYDGMALAQAIVEYIVKDVHAKTLFSTHYHEITGLVKDMPTVKNVHVSVKEKDQDVTFLYKVEDGPMDKSYGINVAKLAGLPEPVLARAQEILSHLEEKKIDYEGLKTQIETPSVPDKPAEENKEALDAVRKADPLTMSPLEALNFLFELKKKVR